jgi:hypothetical protein
VIEQEEQVVLDIRGSECLFVGIGELLFFEGTNLGRGGTALLEDGSEDLFHFVAGDLK